MDKENCPCTRDCPRHNHCDACIESHKARNYPPACQREEGVEYW